MSEKQNNRESHLEPPPGTHCCYYCHFLCLQKLQDETDFELGYSQEPPRAMSEDLRYRCILGCSITNEVDYSFPACLKEHWHYGECRPDQETDLPTILSMDRGNIHCYFRNQPGMTFSAAREVQVAEANRREAEKDRGITLKGIIITAAAAILAAILASILTYFLTK